VKKPPRRSRIRWRFDAQGWDESNVVVEPQTIVDRILCDNVVGKISSLAFAILSSSCSIGWRKGWCTWLREWCSPVGLCRGGTAPPPCCPREEEVTLVVRIVMNERDHICAYRFDASPWTVRSLACGCDRVEVWAVPESLDEDLTNRKMYRFVLCCV
jgi:hypothetical protein